MSKVTNLFLTDHMTVQQACVSAQNFDDAQDILFVGHAKDGHLFVRSSGMSRADALWLCEQLRLNILEVHHV